MWIKALPHLIGAALLIGALIQVNNWRVDAGKLSEANSTIEAMKEEKKANDKLIRKNEATIASLRVKGAKSRNAINAELGSGAGYDCPINANGVRILREAATNHTR